MSSELSEKIGGGMMELYDDSNLVQPRGCIVKTATQEWLAIPSHYRNVPTSVHKLRREAIAALLK